MHVRPLSCRWVASMLATNSKDLALLPLTTTVPTAKIGSPQMVIVRIRGGAYQSVTMTSEHQALKVKASLTATVMDSRTLVRNRTAWTLP